MFLRHFRTVLYEFSRQGKHQVGLGSRIKSSCTIFLVPRKSHFVLLGIPIIKTVHAFGSCNETIATRSNFSTLDKVDKLFDENKYDEVYKELAPYKLEEDVEVLWRLARALYKLSRVVAKEQERQRLIWEGFELAEKALAKAPDNAPVHTWYSVLLDAKSDIEGIKSRILVTEKVKGHMLKAVELNPKDASILYMLGCWCFEVTALPWYQRKIAATLFASPPTSSYEECLEFCERAEKISPNFYSLNLLLMGKAYDRLGQREKAIGFVRRARDYPARTEDDHAANSEAAELLKKWGVKN